MRLYRISSEEALRARGLLKEWVGSRFLTREQYELLERETVSDLRTTNVFLRLVLFLFTLITVGGAIGLFFAVLFSHSSDTVAGVLFLIFAPVCYAGAEVAAGQVRLYRYGIEEALAVLSVGFLCGGLELAFFSGHYSPAPDPSHSLVPAAGAALSLWVWHRFGLSYAFLAAMIFAVFMPGDWTSSHPAQHIFVTLIYTGGLAFVAAARLPHRFDSLDDEYSLVEAMLWLGIYLAINLQLSSWNLLSANATVFGLSSGVRDTSEFAKPFYWTTWVLTWCIPPVMLTRGIRLKDRSVIAAGIIAAILTFISNKPYLGWQRHTWDPMLLGILLTGVAWSLQRWLASGPNGIRHGFTAARLSGRDKEWMNLGSSALGLLSPHAVTLAPQATTPEVKFGGGHSGGGGASSDF
jgi:hypothetical protein